MIQADDAGITVSLEPVVDFTKWVRGKESLTLLEPRPYPTPLNVIGLGKSVAGNITAEAIVVTSFDDLIMK
jgi:carboxypeptidase Q